MSDVKTFVDAKIGKYKVVVFSKTHCPFCTMAKSALDDCNAKYEVVEIENLPECGAIQDYLLELTGGRTVPRVFIDGKCIGGGSETKQLKDSGKLQQMVA